MASTALPAPPVYTIDETGIHQPTDADCLAYFTEGMKGIFGQDLYLGNDTQDGQLCGLAASALHQANSAGVAAYNAFAPSTAQGVGLSRSVGLNGLVRKTASYSTADLRIVGQANTVIEAGVAEDDNGIQWALPALVTIPFSGEITVTATAVVLGAVTARRGTITSIATTTAGWQEVTNPDAAVPGAPIERDAALRIRQAQSTAGAASTFVQSIVAALLELSGVTRVKGYENDTSVTDANGVPARSFAVVIEGGDSAAIAAIIAIRKPPGIPTVGNSSAVYVDGAGIARTIRFYRPVAVPITYRVTLRKKVGYTTDVETLIRQALASWTVARDAGSKIVRSQAYLPAQLYGGDRSSTFELVSVEMSRAEDDPSFDDVVLAFSEAPECEPTIDYIDIVVVP